MRLTTQDKRWLRVLKVAVPEDEQPSDMAMQTAEAMVDQMLTPAPMVSAHLWAAARDENDRLTLLAYEQEKRLADAELDIEEAIRRAKVARRVIVVLGVVAVGLSAVVGWMAATK